MFQQFFPITACGQHYEMLSKINKALQQQTKLKRNQIEKVKFDFIKYEKVKGL